MIFPQSENDLIMTGIELNICVGSEHYRESVLSKESQIFLIKEFGVLKACVEIRTLSSSSGKYISVEQISGFQNQAVEPKFNEFIFRAFQEKFPHLRVNFPCRFPNEQDYHYE